MTQCKSCGFDAAKMGFEVGASKSADFMAKNLLFCPQCGETINAQGFEDEASLKSGSKELREFIAKLDEKVSSKTAQHKEVQSYFDEASKIKHLLEVCIKDEPNKGAKAPLQGFVSDAENFLSQDEFLEIAFVGTIKAGKSTLINALLKRELASMAVTPETATLSKFKWGAKPEIKVTFYSQKEWDKLWDDALKSGQLFKDKYDADGAESYRSKLVGKAPIIETLSAESLAKYTSSQHPEHFFVKEVLISYPEFPYEKNIMFVDTPGLDDPVPYRSNVTKSYIKRAKVVLVCNTVNAMQGGEVRTVYAAFDSAGEPEKVYVLGTHYDTLMGNPVEKWEAQKNEWSKNLTTSKPDGDESKEYTCYTKDLAKKNIIAISGYTGLLCALYERGELNEAQTKDLEDICHKICRSTDIKANLDKLKEFSNIATMNERIKKDILKNAQRYYIEGIKAQFGNLKKSVSDYFLNNVQKAQEGYAAIAGGLESIIAQIEKSQDELKALRSARDDINKVVEDFESQSKSALDKLGEQISALIKNSKGV